MLQRQGRDSEYILPPNSIAPKSIEKLPRMNATSSALTVCIMCLFAGASDGCKRRFQPAISVLSRQLPVTGSIWTNVPLPSSPKETIIRKRSDSGCASTFKIKDASGLLPSFDDIDGAIPSGTFSRSLACNNEDFYPMNLLITITAFEEETWNGGQQK